MSPVFFGVTRVALALLACTAFVRATKADPTDGLAKYSAVTAPNVDAMSFVHYYTPDKKYRQADFEWTFSKNGFVIKGYDAPLPADLLRQFLPKEGAEKRVTQIKGKWRLEGKDGQRLVFTSIEGRTQEGDVAGRKRTTISIFKTAPTLIRLGERQYSFTLSPLRTSGERAL
jgi:hypothetical protein